MSIQYAEQKVAEALVQAKGNKSAANALLFEWIKDDHALLLGMTALHMKGIVPFWTDRVERQINLAAEADKKAKTAALKQQAKKGTVGKEMLRSFAGQKTAEFGLEEGSAPLRRKEASQSHIDAIKMIAEINKKRNKE